MDAGSQAALRGLPAAGSSSSSSSTSSSESEAEELDTEIVEKLPREPECEPDVKLEEGDAQIAGIRFELDELQCHCSMIDNKGLLAGYQARAAQDLLWIIGRVEAGAFPVDETLDEVVGKAWDIMCPTQDESLASLPEGTHRYLTWLRGDLSACKDAVRAWKSQRLSKNNSLTETRSRPMKRQRRNAIA
jgi:hypothetical protein